MNIRMHPVLIDLEDKDQFAVQNSKILKIEINKSIHMK